LEGLVKEATGLESTSSTLNGIVGTFEALKSYANFDATVVDPGKPTDEKPSLQPKTDEGFLSQGDLRFSYTINLNLPNTTDIAVFNAIFKSLRENLLR
jgi:hypothetical protein